MKRLENFLSILVIFCCLETLNGEMAGNGWIIGHASYYITGERKAFLAPFISGIRTVDDSLSKIAATSNKAVVDNEIQEIKKWVENTELTDFGKTAIAVMLYDASTSVKVYPDSELLKMMGPLSLYLDLTHYKQMTKSSLETVVRNANLHTRNTLPIGVKKVIFSRLVAMFPLKEWTSSFVKYLPPFADGFLNNRDLLKLPKKQIGYLMYHLREIDLDCRKTYLLIERYLELHEGEDFKVIFKSMGKSLCFLSFLKLAAIPSDILKTTDEVKDLCKVNWSELQARIIQRLVKKVKEFQTLSSLSCENQKIYGNCWRGVSNGVFQQVAITKDNFQCFRNIVFPIRLTQIWTQKIKRAIRVLDRLPLEEKKTLAQMDPNEEEFSGLLKEESGVLNTINMMINRGLTVPMSSQMTNEAFVKEAGTKSCKNITVVPPRMLNYIAYYPVESHLCKTIYHFEKTYIDSATKKWQPTGILMPLVVIAKSKRQYDNFNLDQAEWASLAVRMGPFVCGFTSDEISKQSDYQFHQFVSEAQYSAENCPAMEDGIRRRFAVFFKAMKRQTLTSVDVLLLGDTLPALDYDILLEMEIDPHAREIAIGYLRGACISGRFPKWRQEALTKISLAMLKVKVGMDLNEDHIWNLGCLVQYIKPAMWNATNSSVIAATSNYLAKFNLNKESRSILFEKFKEFYSIQHGNKNFASMKPEEFRKYFLLIWPFLTDTDLRSFNKDVIIKNRDLLAEAKMSAKTAREALLIIMDSLSFTTTQGGTQSIDLGRLTAIQIMEMGNLIIGLSEKEIEDIKIPVFKEIISFIGLMEGFSKDQWRAWVSVTKIALPSFAKLTRFDVHQMHNILLGIKDSELATLNMKDFVILEEYVKVFNDIPTNLRPFDQRQMTLKDFGGNLHYKLSPLWQTDSKTYANEGLQKTSMTKSRVGEVDGYSKGELLKLAQFSKAIGGPLKNWTRYFIADTGAGICGLDLTELLAISPEDFAVIKPVAIKQIPVNLFKDLSVSQISALNAAQFSAVTEAQRKSLNQEKLTAFKDMSAYEYVLDVSRLYTKKSANQKSMASNVLPTTKAGLLMFYVLYRFLLNLLA